ncbi:hypothetical protein [Mesoterricola sediminis]|uniref:Uncharacterized protein n=1 Tax=Mesoterricola sediminis TaxID=2927980 RepID=A0AA48HDJ2_9BACT|nr:hypothetical protein [Mesoterricola sediminis]BDU76278.1 hypothetical protein METESE_12360 [Mesoterricola sediminis]
MRSIERRLRKLEERLLVKPGKIPIAECKRISQAYHVPLVITFTCDGKDGFQVVTYGSSKRWGGIAKTLAPVIGRFIEAYLGGDVEVIVQEHEVSGD